MTRWIFKNRFILGMLAAFGAVATLAAVNGVFNSVNSVTGYQVNGTAGVVGSALCTSAGSKFNSGCPLPIFGSGVPSGGTCGVLNVGQIYYDTANSYAYYVCKESGLSHFWTGPFGGASASFFYQTVTGQPQEPALTFSGAFSLGDSSGVSTNIDLNRSGTTSLIATVTSAPGGSTAPASFDGVGNIHPSTAFTPRTCNSNGCYDIVNGTIHQWGHVSTPVDGAPGNNVCLPFAFPNNFDKAVITDDFAAGATGTPSVAALTPSGAASPFPCANGGFLVRQTRASNGVYWDATGN